MSTHIIITDAKESKRFPGKNQILSHYTLNWASEEAYDDAHFWYVFREDEEFKGRIDMNNCHILFAPENKKYDDHKTLLEWIYEQINDKAGKYVLLQLTQPVRRYGLLKETIDNIGDGKVVLSYVTWPDNKWRMVDDGTLEYMEQRDDIPHKFFDGAVYGWQGKPDKIFDLKNQEKTWVDNGIAPVCDIDNPWEYSEKYIEGLQDLVRKNQESLENLANKNYENLYK